MGRDSILHSGFIIGLPHDTVETVEEWTGWLERNETPLTSWGLKALVINNNVNENFSYLSEFDINAEKYGYDRSGLYWKNKNWTYKSAVEWISNFYKKSEKKYSKYRTPSAHTAMSLLTLDFTWEEIYNSNYVFDNFYKEVSVRSQEKSQEYFDLLIRK